jgi:asparagine synthase (glutamine-hydrolysing)
MDRPIKSFALGYGDYINELPFAEQASKAIGTDHYTLQATGDLTHELEAILTYFDEPHGDSADFPQHLVSGLAASKVKVALAGDGGDELFLGYGTYYAYWNRPKVKRLYNAAFSNPYKEHLRSVTVFPASIRRALLKDSTGMGREAIDQLVPHVPGNGIDKIDMFDITTYLPGQLLIKVDQASMMHSLEVRCPFLDTALAEFAYNLPTEYKTDKKTGKIILKEMLREIMPNEFVDRKKQGFGAPVRKWLSEEKMQAYVREQFAPGAPVYQVLREEPTRAFVERTFAGTDPKPYYQLWVLLCLAIWMRLHEHAYAA